MTPSNKRARLTELREQNLTPAALVQTIVDLEESRDKLERRIKTLEDERDALRAETITHWT